MCYFHTHILQNLDYTYTTPLFAGRRTGRRVRAGGGGTSPRGHLAHPHEGRENGGGGREVLDASILLVPRGGPRRQGRAESAR